MAMWPKLKFIVSASFLSLVIGLVALYYPVRGTKVNLAVDVAAESNVMDVRTPLKDLAILFQGQDVQKESLNLRILSVRLANEGEANILENYFDSRIPWGLRIDGGRLIEARITGSNSQYLLENLHPQISEGTEVTFEKIIFDKGKYVNLELLVLHNKNVEPQVRPVGKIAGMDGIPVRNSFREHDQEGLTSKAFKGPIAVQIARTIAYFLIGLTTAIAVGFTAFGISRIPSAFKKRARLKCIGYLPKEKSDEKEKKRQVLLQIFVEDGMSGLKLARKMLESENFLARSLSEHRVRIEDRADVPVHMRSHVLSDGAHVVIHDYPPLRYLVEAGLVRRNGRTVEVDPEALELATNLIEQLSEFDEHPNEGSGEESKVKRRKE